jgi:hypothetical protein
MSVATPTATAGLIAEHERLARELVEARSKHRAAERRSASASAASWKAYTDACDIERALDAVEAALELVDKTAKPIRPDGAARIKGKYAHNHPVEVEL